MKETHVSEIKKKEVQILKELIGKYKVIGIIDLKDLPSAQMQKMKAGLKSVLLRVTKKRLLRIVLEAVKEKLKGIEKLEEKLTEDVMPCLVLSNDGSFKLAKAFRKGKTVAAAKPGQISPKEIIIPEGPTPFVPGPIIGELGVVGIKAAVEEGKIVVKQDCVLVKEGEVIDEKKAGILSKFGIEPMEIGLNLLCTYEDGMIYDKSVLDVDEKVYIEQIKEISRDTVVLALEIGYYIKDTAELLIKKAYLEAKSLKNGINVKVEEKVPSASELVEKKKEKPKEEVVIEEKPKEEKKVDIKDFKEVKKEEKKPSAQELVEEISDQLKEEKIQKEQKEKEEKAKKVPTAAELAEEKKEKES